MTRIIGTPSFSSSLFGQNNSGPLFSNSSDIRNPPNAANSVLSNECTFIENFAAQRRCIYQNRLQRMRNSSSSFLSSRVSYGETPQSYLRASFTEGRFSSSSFATQLDRHRELPVTHLSSNSSYSRVVRYQEPQFFTDLATTSPINYRSPNIEETRFKAASELQQFVIEVYQRARKAINSELLSKWGKISEEVNAGAFLAFMSEVRELVNRGEGPTSMDAIVNVLVAASEDSELRGALFCLMAGELNDCGDRRGLVFNNVQTMAEESRIKRAGGGNQTQDLLQLVRGVIRQERLAEFVLQKTEGNAEALELELALRRQLGGRLNLPFPVRNMLHEEYTRVAFRKHLTSTALNEAIEYVLGPEKDTAQWLDVLVDNKAWTSHLMSLYEDKFDPLTRKNKVGELSLATQHVQDEFDAVEERNQQRTVEREKLRAEEAKIDKYLQKALSRFEQGPTDSNRATVERIKGEKKRITQQLEAAASIEDLYVEDMNRLQVEMEIAQKAFFKAVTLSLLS